MSCFSQPKPKYIQFTMTYNTYNKEHQKILPFEKLKQENV